MTIELCPKFETCPLYNEQMSLFSPETLDIYKRSYCLAGKENFTKCKRYQVSETAGTPPPMWVLPNSMLTVEEIIKRMKEDS